MSIIDCQAYDVSNMFDVAGSAPALDSIKCHWHAK